MHISTTIGVESVYSNMNQTEQKLEAQELFAELETEPSVVWREEQVDQYLVHIAQWQGEDEKGYSVSKFAVFDDSYSRVITRETSYTGGTKEEYREIITQTRKNLQSE